MRKFLPPILWLCLLCLSLYPQSPSVQDLQKQLAFVGKLPFKHDVTIRYVSRPELDQYVERIVDHDYPDGLAERENLFVRLMGFEREPVDLKAIKIKLLRESAGGFYNWQAGELLVLSDYGDLNMISALAVVHELRRAMQDQYFGGGRKTGEPGDIDDRNLAAKAALEGDATFAMVQYSREFSSIPLAVDLLTSYNSDALMSFTPISNSTILHRATGFIKYFLMMPYIEGLKYIDVLFKKKKWKEVNRAMTAMPVSSEQVLHPEKYLKKELPVRVLIQYKPEGYRLYHSGVLGEYFANILVMEEDCYVDHAIGWGGDTFELHQSGDSYFLVYKSVWDHQKYASYFFFVMKRFVEHTFKVQLKTGQVGQAGFLAGQSGEGYFFLTRENDKILYVRSNDRVQINKFISGGFYD